MSTRVGGIKDENDRDIDDPKFDLFYKLILAA
jgi:hypothetical protein